MFGISCQRYYRAIWRTKHHREVANQVIPMIKEIRRELPRVGTRKLYHMLRDPLSELRVGRDKLFAIINANSLSIKPLRSYRITTAERVNGILKQEFLLEEYNVNEMIMKEIIT